MSSSSTRPSSRAAAAASAKGRSSTLRFLAGGAVLLALLAGLLAGFRTGSDSDGSRGVDSSVFDALMADYGEDASVCPFADPDDLALDNVALLSVADGVDDVPGPTPGDPVMQIYRLGCVFAAGRDQAVLTMIHSPGLDAVYAPGADPRQPDLVAQETDTGVVVAVRIDDDLWLGLGGTTFDESGAAASMRASQLVDFGNAVRAGFGLVPLDGDIDPVVVPGVP